jgi:hypothetical protein
MARKRSWIATLSIVAVLMSTYVAEARPKPQALPADPQLSSGACVEAWFPLLVDPVRLRPHVPERFAPSVIGGQARINVFAEDCTISLDGGPEIHHLFSGIPVPINPPAGESGQHSYDLLWATDSKPHHRWMQRLGSGSLIEDSVFEYSGGSTATAFAHIPGWFTFTMVGGDPPAVEAGFPLTTFHWQVGRFGAVRNAYDHTESRATPGNAVVRAEPGSPLADIIGTAPIQATGVFFRFNFTGESTVVP